MAEVDDTKALLLDAVQDLFDAERALIERLDKDVICETGDSDLHAVLSDYGKGADDRARQLRTMATGLGGSAGGAPNIWMRAVLDDAKRDTETVEPGPLLDIALTGAIRKGAQAARVSYVTAFKLAEQMARTADTKTLGALRDDHAIVDRRLSARLSALARTVSP